MREVLQRHGLAIFHGEWGKQLGDDLFRFRVGHSAEEPTLSTRSPFCC